MKKRVIIPVSMALVASIILLIYYFFSMKTRNAVERLMRDKKMINILIAGSNKFQDNKHKFFAIATINPENHRIGITFIPPAFRIWQDEKGDRYSRIDEIDMVNFKRIQNSLKIDLKLTVPFYVEIYSPDLERIVNLIEGIDLFILDQVKNPAGEDIGVHYFDGKRIIDYINTVEDNSIYLKFDRIQDVLLTLYYDKERFKKFNNIEFITEMFRSIKTNLMPQEIVRIGDIIFSDGDVISTILPGGFNGNYYVMDDIAYKIYEDEFISSLIIDKEIESAIKVKILNGTNVPGLARKMRASLTRDGLNVVEFGTSSYKKMKNSIIISRKGNYSAANRVAELTGIRNIYHIIDNTQLYSILIIIGDDLISE